MDILQIFPIIFKEPQWSSASYTLRWSYIPADVRLARVPFAHEEIDTLDCEGSLFIEVTVQ